MSCNGQSKQVPIIKKILIKSTHLYADVCKEVSSSKFKLNLNLWIHTVDRCVTNRGSKSYYVPFTVFAYSKA